MATYVLKRKFYGVPTFGLKNIGNALGVTEAAKGMSTVARFGEAAKGAAKLGTVGFVGYQGFNALNGSVGDNSTY